MSALIYHNPRCGKSRNTLAILKEKNVEVEVFEYLKTPPSFDELKNVINLLKIRPEELLRKGEAVFKENYKNKSFSEDEWIEIMVSNPILIERPIVVNNGEAIIGRPPENVLEII